MLLLQSPTFKRAYKRLHATHRTPIDDAIRAVLANPAIGAEKVSDLGGVRVYKCRVAKQLVLLAYLVDADAITLLALGSHENFYRDLKRE